MNYFNPLRSRASAEGGDEDPDSSQNDSQDIHASKHAPSSDTPMQSPNDPPPSQKATSSQQPAASLGHQVRIMFKHNVRRVDYIHFCRVKQSSSSNHTNTNTIFSTPPRVTSGSPPNDANLSPAESIDKVRQFLKEKEGQTLSEWETRGLITFLEKNVHGASHSWPQTKVPT